MEKSVDLYAQYGIKPLSSHPEYAKLVSEMKRHQLSFSNIFDVVIGCGFAVSILRQSPSESLFEVLIVPAADLDLDLDQAIAAGVAAHVGAATPEAAIASAFMVLDSNLIILETGIVQQALDYADQMQNIVPSKRTIN